MELEEMKSLWEEMSVEVEKQKKLTTSLILGMTRINYRNKLNKIIIPEVVASLICFVFAVFVLVNLKKLDTWYTVGCGIISALIMFIVAVLSFQAVYRLNAVNIAANTYQQTLSAYAKAKLGFIRGQKLSFYFGAVLMLTVLPVMTELMGGKDPFKKTNIWFMYVIIYPFFYLMYKWLFKKYMKITADAETLLKELSA